MMKARVIAAIRGAFTADAASMGTHWIYNPAEMKEAVTSLESPEFRDPPTPRYYSSEEFPGHYLSGMLSPYGEQLKFVTGYLASSSSDEAVNGLSLSKAMLEWATTFGGRPDHATTTFMENMKKEDQSGQWPNCGANDDQAHIYMKIVPAACLYAGQPSLLLSKVPEIIRVHQNNDVAVAFGVAAARVLETALLFSSTTSSFVDALDACYDKLSDDIDVVLGPDKSHVKEMVLASYQRGKKEALAGTYSTLDEFLLQLSHEKMKDTPGNAFYDLAARSCALPGAFTGPMYMFYKYATTPMDESVLLTAIRENILASGDTCSRAVFIGAVLSALTATASSSTATLQSLMDKVEPETMNQVDSYAAKIADKRPEDDATCSA